MSRFEGTRDEQVAQAKQSGAQSAPLPPLQPRVIEANREMASRVISRRRFLPFVQRMNARYDAGWVHADLCERLERFSDEVAKGLSPRLMILMPPRHGKSELASKNFPAWHLGRHPDHEFIACSYNLSLAMTFSRRVKQIIDDPAYASVFPLKLDSNNQSTEEWGIAGERGGYVAAGIGGGITGKGAHVLVIDDPVRSAEDADSADGREKVWEWYMSTAYTRLAPGGGVLVIQCMTGDTPVLMADKTERRLDALATGDEIATYASGILATSRVSAVRSNGRDSVLKITTSSGRIVRANQRHPFLTVLPDGGVTWTRAEHLTTAHKIVALKASGANGRELPALRKGVKNLPNVADYVQAITPSKNGPTGTGRQVSIQPHAEVLISNTGTESPLLSTTRSSHGREGYVPYAHGRPGPATRVTGKTASPSTTATPQGKSEVCSATIATQGSGTLPMSQWHLPPHGISDFTLDEIVSIESGGIEEVFDLQVEHTENFIADGLVSHNTWWHDDDLAGRLQQKMAEALPEDDDVDQFEVIKYPAIAESDEWSDPATHEIVRVAANGPAPAGCTLLRRQGEALHPQRYDLRKLQRIRTLNKRSDGADGRWWSALYQQNPVPDDGSYFVKEHFKRGGIPPLARSNVYIAFDFAISEKKQNDYTVGSVGLQDDDDMLHVADVMRFKSGDAFFIVESILNLVARWSNSTLLLGFEDGQIYRAIEALLKKRMRERKLYPAIEVLKPIADKMARARALQGRMQQGMVSFNAEGGWYDVVRAELLRFPAGVHDDCVDSLAWMATLAVGRQAPQKPRQKVVKSWRDRLGTTSLGTAGHMAA